MNFKMQKSHIRKGVLTTRNVTSLVNAALQISIQNWKKKIPTERRNNYCT